MTRQCSRNHWLDFLRLDLGLIKQLKSFVSLLISCLALKSMWFICFQLYYGWAASASGLANLPQHLIMLTELSLLFFCEALLVIRFSFKWQRIEGILRMFFVEYVTVTITPIRKTFHVTRLRKYRLAIIIIFFQLLFLRNNLKILISLPRCRSHIHFVRIYDFCFFFQIERLSIFHHNCFL